MIDNFFKLDSLSHLTTFLVEAALPGGVVVGEEDVQEERGLDGDEFVKIIAGGAAAINKPDGLFLENSGFFVVGAVGQRGVYSGLHFAPEDVADHLHAGMVMQLHDFSLGEVVNSHAHGVKLEDVADADATSDGAGMVQLKLAEPQVPQTLHNSMFLALSL